MARKLIMNGVGDEGHEARRSLNANESGKNLCNGYILNNFHNNNNNNNNNNRYLYSAFSKAQSALQHFVGDLVRLLFTGANCSQAVYNVIIVTVGFIGAPRTEESDKPPHLKLRPLLLSVGVWVL